MDKGKNKQRMFTIGEGRGRQTKRHKDSQSWKKIIQDIQRGRRKQSKIQKEKQRLEKIDGETQK